MATSFTNVSNDKKSRRAARAKAAVKVVAGAKERGGKAIPGGAVNMAVITAEKVITAGLLLLVKQPN